MASWQDEARLFLNLAGPSVLIQIFEFLIWFENAVYIGQTQGTNELAAISLANLAGNLSAMSLLFGMLTAVDTLAPQAIGRGDKGEVGLLCQRGLLACTAMMPIIAVVWGNMEWVLVTLGQPPEVSRLAGVFLKVYLLAIPPMILYNVVRRFLQVQNIIRPFISMSGFVALFWHPMLLWVCITWMNLRIIGAAVATTLSFLTLCALSGLHVLHNQPANPSSTWLFFFDGTYDKATWRGIDTAEAMNPKAMREFAWLGVSGVVSMTEWWYWEAAAFVAGRLGPVALAAHSVAYNIIPLAFMVPLGISIGTTTRQGNLLGEGNPKRAWDVAKYSLLCGTVVIVSVSLVIQHSAKTIVPLFSHDEEVVKAAYEIWPWFSVFTCFDGIFGIQRGILIGLGRQLTLGVATIIVLWMMGLPIMLYVVISRHGGLIGLWQSLLATYAFFNCALIFGYAFADWDAISVDVQAKAGSGPTPRKLKLVGLGSLEALFSGAAVVLNTFVTTKVSAHNQNFTG